MSKIKKYLLILPLFLLVFNVSITKAQTCSSTSIWGSITEAECGGLKTVGGDVFGGEEPENNIPEIVAKVMMYLFTFLGTIFLVLIIYGGFLYMTAGGGSDKISEAKEIIINASIGLTIILASYSFTYFIIKAATGATGTAG
jgi:hypothetical protein